MKLRHQGPVVVRWLMMLEKKRKYPGMNKKGGFDRCLLVLDRWMQRRAEEEETRIPLA
jgi:hypothetical protein